MGSRGAETVPWFGAGARFVPPSSPDLPSVRAGGSYFRETFRFPMLSSPPRLYFFALLALAAALATRPAHAQPAGVLQLGDDVTRFLERQHAAGRLPAASLTHAPLSAAQARVYLDTLAAHEGDLDRWDRALLDGFRGVTPLPGARAAQKLWGVLYRDGQNVVSAEGGDSGSVARGYRLTFNPLLYLSAGRAAGTRRDGRTAASVPVWQNTRGVRAAGHVGPAFFEVRVEENQRRDARDPFDLRGGGTAPRLGNVQRLNEAELDYYRATGVVGMRTRYFEASGGRDRVRWGTARGNLLLSGYAAPFDHVQIRTNVWRVEYVALYARFTSLGANAPNRPYETTRGAFHRLTVRLPGRVEVEAFEGIVFGDDTLGTRRRGFDVAYLNPVIFLRSAEQDRGSPDNALVGAGASWVAVPGVQVYGQALADEFTASLVGKKSWANKWGLLAGIRVALGDVGPLRGVLVQAEAARLRPYLYSHLNERTAFVHYGSGLGHPAGPNAEDFFVSVEARFSSQLSGRIEGARTRRGRNAPNQNFGSDPRLSYNSRVSDTGIAQGQGVRQTLFLLEAHADYRLLPGLALEAAVRAMRLDDAETGPDRYVAPSLGLRWGLPFRSARYD